MRTAALRLLLTLPALSACQRTASDPTLQKAPVAAVSVADDAGSTTAAAAPPVEERQTEQYRLRIERSAMAPTHLALRRAVEAHLAQQRDQFVGQALAAQEEGFQFDQPWELQLQVQPTLQRDDLIVLELTGSEYTGGAHGLPLLASFVYLPPPADQVLAIEDWFDGDAVWAPLSEAALAALVQVFTERDGQPPNADAIEWFGTGAGPDPANFAHYVPLLDEAGLIHAFAITFQPYQVASYADGMPRIELALAPFRDFVHAALRDRIAN